MNYKYEHVEGYDCLDDAMSIAFDKHNNNYNAVFVKSWCFNFDLKNDTIGQSLDGNRGDRFQILNDIFGAEFECYTLSNKFDQYPLGKYLVETKIDKKDIHEVLIKNMQDVENEIIVQFDTFSFPWDNLFQKYHGTHMCYINSYQNEKIELYDRWYSTSKLITLEEFLNNAYKIIVIKFKNVNIKINDEKKFMQYIEKLTDFNKIKNSLNMFIDKIKYVDIEKEFSDCTKNSYTKAPIMRNLKEAVYNKKQLCIFFNELYKKYNNEKYKKLSEVFEKMAQDFEIFRMCLAKEFLISEKKYEQDIIEISKDLMDGENKAIQYFFDLNREIKGSD